MKIQLSDDTVSALEEVSGKKITRNGDQVIREVCEMAENNQENNSEPSISVCSQTEKMVEDDEQ